MHRMCLLSAAFVLFAADVRAGTSNSLMDVSPDGKLLLVANTDSGTVTVIDTAKKEKLREIVVGTKPEGVTWIGAGPRAAVTLYGANQVVFFDATTGAISKKLPVKFEPYGIVSDAAGKRAWISHDYPGIVSEIDLDKETVTREIPAGSFTRGIAYSPADNRLYVSEFFTGILRAIDLTSGKELDSWKGHSTDNLSRHVLVHPNRPKAYLAHIRSIVNFIDGAGSIFPSLSICDLKPGEGKRRVALGMDTFNGIYVVTNPWESAMSPDGKRFYVIYAGTNDMNYCDVIDDDYREIERVGNAARTGQNPRAVRVSPDSKTVYIYNAMDFAVAVHDASNMRQVAAIKTCAPPKSPEWVRGKVLFNTANPPMTQRRWIACSSCHPDGLHDARVWQQPEGLRKTTALMGMAHTHPLHWSADRDEVQDFEYTIRSKLMQGTGLLKGSIPGKRAFEKAELEYVCSGKSKDLDALAIYSNSFEPPPSPHLVDGKLSPAAERGKTLFFSKEVNCASCHSGPYYTDSSLQKPYKLHDIGTGRDDKRERMGTAYDTPTLVGIYRTAPYLHDGKAKTLLDVLTTCNKEDKHGKTSHLSPGQLDDLVEFLKSLPYEPLPAVTPNTVPYRLITTNKE
jgi:YVTN family beta-propeller protein